MKAMVVRRYGNSDTLELRDWPEPELKPGGVVIRVRAIGINFADLLQRMGIYPGTPKPPFIPGFEVAGVVERASPSEGNSSIQAGDRVVAFTRFNAYAEFAAAPAASVYRIPESMPFEDAAAIPVNYLTAYHSMFHMGNLQPGDRILVHGAAGGVGIAAVQLAKTRGLIVFGTAGASKQEFLRQIGVDFPMDYTREDFVEVIRQSAPEGIEMALDPVGGESFTKSYDCLGPTGRLVIYGFSAASGPSGKRNLLRGGKALLQTKRYHPMKLMRDNKAVIGVHLGRLETRGGLLRTQLEEIFRMYADGRIRPHIGKTFPLSEAPAAHRYIHARQNIGKVILTVS
ncbi:MAG: zinc-binding dehydrogenase [Candidatus Acidiferrales bacterium]